VNLILNGEAREVATGVTVATIVKQLGHLTDKGLAVALNGEVVPRSAWDASQLHEGDRIEVLSATQGG
jgi:sulfur carrier protein